MRFSACSMRMMMIIMLLWGLGSITISTPENKLSDSDNREEDVHDIDCLSKKQLPSNAEASFSKK